MAETLHRILGENHNRLLIIDDVGNEPPKPGHVTRSLAAQLLKAGWAPYNGPAEAKAGWVVAGTDPALKPRKYGRP